MSDGVDSGRKTWPDSEVRAHLERILASRSMARSESLSSFLRFTVEETLAGRGGRLKARVIAVHALGRNKQFDPRVDPIVAIQAGRLRRALERYYEHEGSGELMRIELPKGGYQPKFRQVDDRLRKGDLDGDRLSSARPSVAVIPLVDLDANAVDDYFAVGLTQELVASIAQFPELRVIAVPPLEAGDSVVSIASKLCRESGVRFVLSGTLRRTSTTLILRMQLTDALSAAVVWTEKITRHLTAPELIDLQEDVSQQVARTVAENYGVIPRTLTREVHRKRTDELSVYDAILKFRHYQCVVTNEARDCAVSALEQAIELDPNYALCWAMLSEAVADAYGLRIDCRSEVVSRARELARRSIALDPHCQHAHWALAYAHFHARERDSFLRAAERTIELNPNNGFLVGIAAWAMTLAGEWDRGLFMLNRLMDQNPYYPTWMHLAPYLENYRTGEFEAALDHANKFNIPTLAWDPILRAAALSHVGSADEAGAALSELMTNFPDAAADPAHYMRGYMFIDELVDDVVDGLRKAGWNGSEWGNVAVPITC